jgi:hypothetical protein
VRSIGTALQTEQNKDSREGTATVVFRRLRLSFSEFTTVTNPWGYADAEELGGEPYVFGDSIVTSGGYIFRIWISDQTGDDGYYVSTDTPGTAGNWAWSQVPTGIVLSQAGNSNVGLYETGGTVYVFYLSTGAALKYRTCDEDGTGWSSENNAGTFTFPNGSCVAPVSENEVFVMGATNGALTIQRAFNSGGWTVSSCPYQFYGNDTWSVTGTELGSVSRFDAVSLADGTVVLFVTLNDPGESYIIRYKDGVWGDPQRLPGDEYGQLTLYRASFFNDKIWVTGRMYRPGPDTAEAQAWDCVLISEDGEHWEFHRDQYVIQPEVRGQYLLLDGYVWYAGVETVYRAASTSIIDSSDPAAMKTTVADDLHGFTLNRARSGLSDSMAVEVANGDGTYDSDLNLISGAEVEIQAGYNSQEIQLAIGSVDTPERILASGQKALQLACRDRAFKFMKTFVSPYYYPMLSQLKKYDDCDAMDNLYIINGGEYEADLANDRIGYTSLAHDGILLSATPAEAKDCRLIATFETTVDPADADSSFGIILGHSDNDNYILVRVKTGTVSNVTLEKNVDGSSSTLDTQDFSVTHNSKYDVAVAYEGGRIRAWVKEDSQSDFGDALIDYTWDATADNPIRTDDGFGKAGVYTKIHSLQTGLLAFGRTADAVPVDTSALGDYASFPSSGTLVIDNEKISYTAKTLTAKAVSGLTVNGVGPWRDYDNPGGSSEGDESYDFDGEYGIQIDGKGTVQVATYYDNYAIVSVTPTGEAGPRFWAAKIKGYVPEVPDEWVASVDGGEAHVGDTGYGSWTDVADRRVITDLSSLGAIIDGDEVRIAPAFYGLTRGASSTNPATHAEGDTIALHVDGEIRIHELVVTDLDKDKSVEWMLKHIGAMAGIHNSYFNELYSSASLSVTGGGTSAWDSTGTWLTGVNQRDFELNFEMPSLTTGDKLGIAMRAASEDWDTYTGAAIIIEALGSSKLSVGLFENGADTALDKVNVVEPDTGVNIRVVSQGEFFTLYFEDKLIWTWHTTSFQGTDTNYLGFSYYNGASISLSNVRVPELGERREAAAIEVNKTCMNAIGGVLEDRPIELFATSDGGFKASFFDSRDDAGSLMTGGDLDDEIFIEMFIPTDTNFFSVVQVYCEDVVEIVDHELANAYGFVFLPVSAPSLSIAEGIKEGERILERSKELRDTRNIKCRAFLHVERGDTIDVDYTSLHGDVVSETVIVNDINYGFGNAFFEMKMGCRKQAV